MITSVDHEIIISREKRMTTVYRFGLSVIFLEIFGHYKECGTGFSSMNHCGFSMARQNNSYTGCIKKTATSEFPKKSTLF